MTVQFVASHTADIQKTSGTGLLPSLSGQNVSGNLLVMWIGFDNLSATTPTVSSISGAGGDSWFLIKVVDSGAPSAAAGCRGELWGILTTSAYTTSQSFTVTLSGAVVARIAVLAEFSGVTSTIRSGSASGTGTSAPTATTTGGNINAGDLILGGGVTEHNANWTADSDTLDGSWVNPAGLN